MEWLKKRVAKRMMKKLKKNIDEKITNTAEKEYETLREKVITTITEIKNNFGITINEDEEIKSLEKEDLEKVPIKTLIELMEEMIEEVERNC